MSKKMLLDWERVVEGGFGNKHNLCAWSMNEYKKQIYVGTLNFANGCQVYRSNSGDKGTWRQVNENGFGDSNKSEGARTMIVFKNLLWIATFSMNYGTQIWVTNGEDNDRDGIINWKKANINGFGEGNRTHGSRAMIIYNDKLHIGTQCKKGLPRIYSYNGPTDFDKIQPDKWDFINNSMQNDIQNIPDFSLVGEMINFKTPDTKDYIYAAFYSEVVPLIGRLMREFNTKNLLKIIKFFTLLRCKIWRYNGIKWEEISRPGFGKSNIMTMSSLFDKKTIYFGTTNILGGEIWKTGDGEKWVRIVKRGFGYPFNISVWRLHKFENKIIVGMQNQWLGCQIWASTKENPMNNKDFVQIGRTGMQQKIQYNPFKLKQDGIRTFETFNNYLYAGTASDVNIIVSDTIGPGCEIWRIKNI